MERGPRQEPQAPLLAGGGVTSLREKCVVELTREAYVPGEVVLSSGVVAEDYVDCQRSWSRNPLSLKTVGVEILKVLHPEVRAVGGLTMGADPIAYAVALASLDHPGSRIIHPFAIRKAIQGHGYQNLVEGCPDPGTKVCVLEDVITTGGSVLRAVRECQRVGLEVVQVVAVVDREMGGVQRVCSEAQVPVTRITDLSEIRSLAHSPRGCYG